MYTLGDIQTLVKEGIPYADSNNLCIESSMGYDIATSDLVVKGEISIPLNKIGDISIQSYSPGDLVESMVHPLLKTSAGFSVRPGASTIKNGFYISEFHLYVQVGKISDLARRISETRFYSALEKALED